MAGIKETGPNPRSSVSNKEIDHVDEAIRVAVSIATRQAQEMREIRARCERGQYDTALVQLVRHLVGLGPDPQLSDKEQLNECQSSAPGTPKCEAL
jgi:hypothetical protein